MPIRSKDDGTTALGPYLSRLAACIERAWYDVTLVPADHQVDMSTRCRANYVNDRMLAHARREFESDPEVRFVRGRGGLFLLAIGEAFLLRFKKLKSDLTSSNIPTQQSLAFAAQGNMELPGMPARLTHVNAGYILNRMQTGISSAHITCPNGSKVLWTIDLFGDAAGEVVPMSQPTPAPTKGTTVVPRRGAGAKRAREQKGQDDDDDTDPRNR